MNNIYAMTSLFICFSIGLLFFWKYTQNRTSEKERGCFIIKGISFIFAYFFLIFFVLQLLEGVCDLANFLVEINYREVVAISFFSAIITTFLAIIITELFLTQEKTGAHDSEKYPRNVYPPGYPGQRKRMQ